MSAKLEWPWVPVKGSFKVWEVKVVGLRDVASHAGVSMPTASRVLSGSNYPVTDERRQRVLDAAAQLDYVPNRQAQALVSGNRGGVGVLVGDVGDPYFTEIVHGIYDVAVSENLLVTICSTQRNVARELEYFRMLQANRTEIVILAGSGLDDPEYKKGIAARTRSFLPSGGRVVRTRGASPGSPVSLGDPGTGVSHVLTDNVLGGELLGRHLADLGHQKIAGSSQSSGLRRCRAAGTPRTASAARVRGSSQSVVGVLRQSRATRSQARLPAYRRRFSLH